MINGRIMLLSRQNITTYVFLLCASVVLLFENNFDNPVIKQTILIKENITFIVRESRPITDNGSLKKKKTREIAKNV